MVLWSSIQKANNLSRCCCVIIIMVALWTRGDHYIFILWFLLSCSFFPRLISAVGDWMSAYFHTWCGLSANLGCSSETRCTRLAGNAGHKKSPKSPSAHHRTTLSGYIFTTKARIDDRKKNLSSNISAICPCNIVNLRPTSS